MRKLIFAGAAVAALMATVPASAQTFLSNDPAAGDGSDGAAVPAYGGNHAARDFDYATACRVLRERPVVSRGATSRAHRSC